MNATADQKPRRYSLPNYLTKLKNSAFVKSIFVVMTGTAMAQAIGFALTPIVSRLFSPTDFGILGSFNTIAGILAAGVTLDYSQAIMLPKEKENAINMFALSFVCTVIVCIFSILWCLVTPTAVNGLMKTAGILPMALLILSTLVSGITESCQAWSIRAKAFKHTSASQVIRSLSSNGMRIGFGYLKAGSMGLIVSTVLANILASINLVCVLLSDLSTWKGCIRWDRVKQLAKEYRDFPMYSASQSVINTLSTGMPILLLARFYGIAVAGAYAFGITVLQVPMSFVMTALRQVLFQKACETEHQGGSLAKLYLKTTVGLFAMGLFPSLILIIWAPQIFSLVFGPQWSIAGELARSLVIWMAVVFCNLPAVLFARIIRLQRFVFFYDLALLFARTLALVFGGLYFKVSHTVMVFALVGAIMNTFLIIRVGRAVMKKEGPVNMGRFYDFLMQA